MTEGWLLDAYPCQDRMVFWIKQKDGKAVRLEDSWTHSIYVAGEASEVKSALARKEVSCFVKKTEPVERYERITDLERRKVFKLDLWFSSRAAALARRIEALGKFGKFRLYNVDVLPAQSYFYEHELFPLAYCDVEKAGTRLKWTMMDDVWSTDYPLPDFKQMRVDVIPRKQGLLPKFTDRIDSIVVRHQDETIEIRDESEVEMIRRLVSITREADPDFILTSDGDSFGFPYLIHRAQVNKTELVMGRDPVPLARPKKEGTSYFSYGRIHFKPAAIKLLGRVHMDHRNSFVYDESGLHGFYEVARICRMPLHTAFRASIGKCLSGLQFYHAHKRGLLVPWKPAITEHFKTYAELLVADRGGLIFEPEIGVHEKVAEFDFSSLYPSIMYKKNVSGETVRCECCPDSKLRVPDLDYNICEKRIGIVPASLEIVIKKRAKYKELKKRSTGQLKQIYDSRQNALKWINVTSFGYLGFNNSKFGRIDAHIAVCAFDRQLLMQAARIAEREGYKVLHGIVDSLWVKKDGATNEDYMRLKEQIGSETGFDISFEGEYKWIAFLESKVDGLPVPNRYFGAFSDGSLKIRGIEARRHDTPKFFSDFQVRVLQLMAKGNSVDEVRALMPEVKTISDEHVAFLKTGKVPIEELAFTKQTSKDAADYEDRDTVEGAALRQLAAEGKPLKAGQVMRYVVTAYRRKKSNRSVPVEMIDGKTAYDARRYIELLIEVCDSVTKPFGYNLQLA